MNKDSLAIPAAIVIAAGLISGAIYLNGAKPTAPGNLGALTAGTGAENETPPTPVVEPVTEDDHIRGNPNAPVMIVEYSDYDCPYCKNFHETMNQIMDEYGVDGQVAWVYRHFPLQQLHPNAPRIAEAAECVAESGGNEAFWTFSDLVFGERTVNEATDISRLPDFAEQAGADRNAFELCYNSRKYQAAIEEDVNAAIAAGGRGTPHSIVIVGDQQGEISGAQPYGTVKQIIDNLLSQIGG